MQKHKGLTLIELVIVVGVLVLLALLFSFSLSASQGQIRDAKRAADLNAIQTAIQFYYNANGSYPDPIAEEGNAWGNLDELLAPYMSEEGLPTPPKSDENYVYLFEGDNPEAFVVGAVLENDRDKNLLNDSDLAFPTAANWRNISGVTSSGGTVSSVSCADPVYCVTE